MGQRVACCCGLKPPVLRLGEQTAQLLQATRRKKHDLKKVKKNEEMNRMIWRGEGERRREDIGWGK